MDITGRIPTLNEYNTFTESSAKNKRHELIDQLIDSPGYVSSMHNHWMDALRVKYFVGKTKGLGYKLWIRNAIQKNMPYDEFVEKLISSEGRLYDPDQSAVGYMLRDRLMLMDNVANTMQLFLGTDMLCAQCHDHPFKKWTQMDFYKIAAFFNDTVVNATHLNRENKNALKKLKPKNKQQMHSYQNFYKDLYQGVYKGGSGTIRLPKTYEYDDGKPNELIQAGVPYGNPVKIDYDKPVKDNPYNYIEAAARNKNPDVKSRKHFAKWVTSPDNPMFTKTIVNRLWFKAFGAPLVDDLLDMKPSEMGKNPKLTEFLIRVMKLSKYDQKVFLKVLYKTDAYQRDAVNLEKTKYYHQAPVVKRLSSEEIWDSLLAIRTKNPDKDLLKGSLMVRNVKFMEMDKRNADERLKLLAKPGKFSADYDMIPNLGLGNTGIRASLMRAPKGAASFLDIYGQSERELIDGAIKEATIPQALHLMNNAMYTAPSRSSYISDELKKLRSKSISEKIQVVYQTVLTRKPTSSELSTLSSAFKQDKNMKVEALLWALINSNEFKVRN